jgi:hypothetical protein
MVRIGRPLSHLRQKYRSAFPTRFCLILCRFRGRIGSNGGTMTSTVDFPHRRDANS